MKPVKIGNVYVGSCWTGTPRQIEETQRAIDEECALYEEDEEEDENNGDRGEED